MFFEMVVGFPPFFSENPSDTCKKIVKWKEYFSIPSDANLSSEAENFILRMVSSPENRLGIHGVEEIMKHPFFKGINWNNIRNMKAPFIPEIKNDYDTKYFDTFPEQDPFYPPINTKNKQRKDVNYAGYTFNRDYENMKDGFLLVNKDIDWTSRDVCNKISHIFDIEKVGHNGTLDPFATGLLLIACGKATRILNFIEDCQKTYVAKLILGKKTSTGDLNGEAIEEKEVVPLSKDDILKVFESLKGNQKQVPPMTSAVHYNGRKLYELAHQGKSVEREPRDITIYDLKLLEFSNSYIEFEATVSKGTYIRTLGETIAEKLSNVGYLESLNRTKIGSLKISDSKRILDLTENDFVSIEKVAKDYMEIISFSDEETISKIKHGGKLSLKLFPNKENLVLLTDENCAPLAVYARNEKHYDCARNLN